MMKRGIYVGAGTDTVFLERDFETMVCVESMPGGSYRFHIEEPNSLLDGGDPILGIKPCLYNYSWFIKELLKNYEDFGFNLVSHEDKLMIFQNQDKTKTVEYYCNTFFPEEFSQDQDQFDFLYISGFCPEKDVMKLMKEKFEIYSSSRMCYEFEDGEATFIYLVKNEERISKWTLIGEFWNENNSRMEYDGKDTIYENLSEFMKYQSDFDISKNIID